VNLGGFLHAEMIYLPALPTDSHPKHAVVTIK